MDINRNTMSALYTYYSKKFGDAFAKAAVASIYQKFCMMEGNASSKILEFPFLESFAFMREWLGDRQIKNLASKKLRMVEKPFEDTVGVPMRDIETDTWGQYGTIIAQLGQAGEQLWDRLAVEAILANANWIDDLPFFNDTASGAGARKYKKSVIVNKTTAALTAITFALAYKTMSLYCDHVGESLGVVPTHLMVGPALYDTAWDILVNEFSYDATDKVQVKNKNKGRCELILNKRFAGTSANHWYLMDCSGEIKPVIIQQSKLAKLTRIDAANDEIVFMQGKALYGTDAYGSAALAFPHLCYAGIVAP
ncbi:MAG: Mu-like prophage major head subunit gpT family protein [Victivallaceae bacterium]